MSIAKEIRRASSEVSTSIVLVLVGVAVNVTWLNIDGCLDKRAYLRRLERIEGHLDTIAGNSKEIGYALHRINTTMLAKDIYPPKEWKIKTMTAPNDRLCATNLFISGEVEAK